MRLTRTKENRVKLQLTEFDKEGKQVCVRGLTIYEATAGQILDLLKNKIGG